jgi:hypothetical protein
LAEGVANGRDELVVKGVAQVDNVREGRGVAEVAGLVELNRSTIGAQPVENLLPICYGRQTETWHTGAVVACVVELLWRRHK